MKRRENIPYQVPANQTGEIVLVNSSDHADVLKRIEDGTFTSVLLQDGGFRKSVIFKLVRCDQPFTSVTYGAGVYRLLREERMNND